MRDKRGTKVSRTAAEVPLRAGWASSNRQGRFLWGNLSGGGGWEWIGGTERMAIGILLNSLLENRLAG
ncbi:hypothetical protein EAI28_20625 [Faecalicatena contorta]|nr:hypothetical protein [Faecalicatena contorta]